MYIGICLISDDFVQYSIHNEWWLTSATRKLECGYNTALVWWSFNLHFNQYLNIQFNHLGKKLRKKKVMEYIRGRTFFVKLQITKKYMGAIYCNVTITS